MVYNYSGANESVSKSGQIMMKNRNRMLLVGERLKRAREALGYTQERVAEELNIGRPRYSDIENGKRDVPLKQLYKFCDFFGRPLNYFIKDKLAVEGGFNLLFRETEGDHEIASIVTEFENLCEKMYELEDIAEVKIKSPVFEDYDYDKNRLRFWGKYYADQERNRLNLGRVPVKNLDEILEEKCSLKIFYLPIPEGRGIFGMFTFDENRGGCILINANPTAGNQLFSLAHEYGHFIFHKERLGIISSEEQKNTSDEQLANYFASEFLMPENSIKDIFYTRIKNSNDTTAEDIIYLGDYFGVSFKAMIYRLNNLRLLDNNRKEELINETSIAVVRRSMGISEPERGKSKFPPLYLHLCIKAYQKKCITTAKLAELLELPLYQTMAIGKEIKRSTQDAPNPI